MCQKNNFQMFLLIAIEMAVLSVFSKKKDLGPLGVNNMPYVHRGPKSFQKNNQLESCDDII